MACVNEGSHSFICQSHVHPTNEMNHDCLYSQLCSIVALCQIFISHRAKGRRLVGLGDRLYSEKVTNPCLIRAEQLQ